MTNTQLIILIVAVMLLASSNIFFVMAYHYYKKRAERLVGYIRALTSELLKTASDVEKINDYISKENGDKTSTDTSDSSDGD